MSYSNEYFREIILDHVKNPRNKEKQHINYFEKTLKNPSCGDIVTIYALINNGIVEDITYKAAGCSLCLASTSMLSELLIGKTVDQIKLFGIEFNKMVQEENFNKELLDEMISLSGVSKIPARIKCVTLSYKALTELIEVI